MKLYDFELSGNCYKVRLFLSILGLEYQNHQIDFYPGREHKSDWFLGINPLGQLPVLETEGRILRDAQAILTWLALKYDKTGQWYPVADADRAAKVMEWMFFADQLTATSSAARLHDTMMYQDIDVEAARKGAHRLLRILDEHLWFGEKTGFDWLVAGDHPSIADLAVFPYVALSEDGGISRIDYPALRRWLDRVKRIKGFVGMSGVFHTSAARL